MIKENPLVIYDCECNLCSGSVRFIIKRDPAAKLRFVSLQSATGEKLLREAGFEKTGGTLVLLDKGNVYTKSSAVLRITKYLRGGWKLFYIFLVVPKQIRDFFYTIISKNRHRWFGRTSCMVPSKEDKFRFKEWNADDTG